MSRSHLLHDFVYFDDWTNTDRQSFTVGRKSDGPDITRFAQRQYALGNARLKRVRVPEMQKSIFRRERDNAAVRAPRDIARDFRCTVIRGDAGTIFHLK